MSKIIADKKTDAHKKATPLHALIPLIILIAAMLYTVVLNGGSPHIPLSLGCTASAVSAAFLKYTWDEILGYIIDGITQSLEAILILLLIGCLVGIWIASGTVPTMVYYGLSLISAKAFLLASTLTCGIVSFAIGAWGTVGTVGIALMGIGTALNVPTALIAGSIVSGSYFGDAMSPLSDATNLTSAVVGENVFSVVKKRIAPIMCSFFLACLLYFFVGLKYSATDGHQILEAVTPLKTGLMSAFKITPLSLLPMLVVVTCILLKFPAIPSMLLGVVSGFLTAVFIQGADVYDLLLICTEGHISESGEALFDTLFTAGGMNSMMNTILIILIAMAFGGVMQKTGQMRALISPLLSKTHKFGNMNAVTVLSCVLMNVLLPDQYLGISVPGQMLQEEYDSRSYSRVSLATGLVGGAVSSPIIPWNTCGLYCMTILGVSPTGYARYAFFNVLTVGIIIIFGFISLKKHQ